MFFNHAHALISSLFSISKPFSSSSKTSPLSLQCLHLTPNSLDFLSLLSSLTSLRHTKQAHALIHASGRLPSSVSVSASLLLNYAKFNDPTSALFLFQSSLPYCKSAYLWNTLLRGYSIAGVFDVFNVYNRMIRANARPDDHTLPFVIKACADHSEIRKAKEVHGFAIKVGFDRNVYLGNTLLLFYSSCGDIGDARKVFDEMPERDIVSWNTMIGAYSGNGLLEKAVEAFLEMMLGSGLMPNVVSVVSLLPVCAGLKDAKMVRMIHGYVFKVGLDCLVTVCNTLIDAYGKCGEFLISSRIFDETVQKNTVSWNAIITSLAHGGCYSDAIEMFRLMIDAKGKPDGITISSMLPALIELKWFDAGKEVHGLSIRMGLDSDLFISNSLIDMYAKSGLLAKASSIFYNMEVRDVVTWNAMVANFAQNNHEAAAIGLVSEMQALNGTPNVVTFINVLPACARVGALRSGKEVHTRCVRTGASDDIFVSNALIDMYSKCGLLELAQNVFHISSKDQVSYNTLIVGYSQANYCAKALKVFKEMGLMDIKRDTISYVGGIAACTNFGALKPGKEIHGVIIRQLLHKHLFICNALLDLYMKCGKVNVAQKIFNQIQEKDVTSWNTMILGYAMLGKVEKAIDFFEEMREDDMNQDSISFIAVLSACSHGGLVEKGKTYFEEMQSKGMTPTLMHYTCMVDLLGRAGLMEEVVKLIRELPLEPDPSLWGALLGASRVHGNIELAKWAAEHLIVLKPEHSGYYVLLSNMLSEAGRWDEATRVRELMKSKGVKKNPAYSWIQVRDQNLPFLIGDSIGKTYVHL